MATFKLTLNSQVVTDYHRYDILMVNWAKSYDLSFFLSKNLNKGKNITCRRIL